MLLFVVVAVTALLVAAAAATAAVVDVDVVVVTVTDVVADVYLLIRLLRRQTTGCYVERRELRTGGLRVYFLLS